VLLHCGYGAYTSGEKQSLTVLNLETNELRDFPDERLAHDAKQSYFLGLAFSLDGRRLYASMASLNDPLGKGKGNTGNGIAVYGFERGIVKPERFLPLAPRKEVPQKKLRRAAFKDVTYPAGLSVGMSEGQERILVACNGSDEAVLLNSTDGKIVWRFDLSTYKRIPGSLPYTTVMTAMGKKDLFPCGMLRQSRNSIWRGCRAANDSIAEAFGAARRRFSPYCLATKL